jgi:hypothetical protein
LTAAQRRRRAAPPRRRRGAGGPFVDGLLVVTRPRQWRARCWSLDGYDRGCAHARRQGYLTCRAHADRERFARALYFVTDCPDREGVERPAEGSCRGCGCTDERACTFGCAWVEIDLCSACVPRPALHPLERARSS